MERRYYTFTDGSKELGKNKNYLSFLAEKHPKVFEGITPERVGGRLIITAEELETIKERIPKYVKKEGVHVEGKLSSGLRKQSSHLLLTPN